MGPLSCKTPAMVRGEIAMHMPACNRIRAVITKKGC